MTFFKKYENKNYEIRKTSSKFRISKKLKKLGVEQESLFYHVVDEWREKPHKTYIKFAPKGAMDGYYSAFTGAELGEMLPDTYKSGRYSGKYYAEQYEDNFDLCEGSSTEADARAKMLIHLLEK